MRVIGAGVRGRWPVIGQIRLFTITTFRPLILFLFLSVSLRAQSAPPLERLISLNLRNEPLS